MTPPVANPRSSVFPVPHRFHHEEHPVSSVFEEWQLWVDSFVPYMEDKYGPLADDLTTPDNKSANIRWIRHLKALVGPATQRLITEGFPTFTDGSVLYKTVIQTLDTRFKPKGQKLANK